MKKHLSISNEQVDMVLQMCKDSFPEYMNIRFVTRWGEQFYFDSEPPYHIDPHEYNWFELVVTELSNNILIKMEKFYKQTGDSDIHPDYENGGDLLYNAMEKGEHIINLLYKQFKRLESWQLKISKQSKEDCLVGKVG